MPEGDLTRPTNARILEEKPVPEEPETPADTPAEKNKPHKK